MSEIISHYGDIRNHNIINRPLSIMNIRQKISVMTKTIHFSKINKADKKSIG